MKFLKREEGGTVLSSRLCFSLSRQRELCWESGTGGQGWIGCEFLLPQVTSLDSHFSSCEVGSLEETDAEAPFGTNSSQQVSGSAGVTAAQWPQGPPALFRVSPTLPVLLETGWAKHSQLLEPQHLAGGKPEAFVSCSEGTHTTQRCTADGGQRKRSPWLELGKQQKHEVEEKKKF